MLRRRDSGESDRRLTLLTEELGKIDAVAKGARKAASRLAGISDPLTAAVLTLATGKRNAFVTQAQPVSAFRQLRADYDRLTYGLALAELYAAVCPYEQPFPEAFELLRDSLVALEHHEKPLVALVWAQARLLAVSGFMPQLERCVDTDEPVQEAEPFLSPRAGGLISTAAAIQFTDRVRTRFEAVVGILKSSELETPPPNLKFAPECLRALLPFWRHIAEAPLPACEGVAIGIHAS